MKPSRLAAALRLIASRIDNSKKPSKVLVARELRRVISAIQAAGSFYVEWEGNKYTDLSMKTDIDLMRSVLGEGPIYFGTDSGFPGGFFSKVPKISPDLVYLRGGEEDFDTSEMIGELGDGSSISWEKYNSWDSFIENNDVFDESV